jgi:hypothetical protein
VAADHSFAGSIVSGRVSGRVNVKVVGVNVVMGAKGMRQSATDQDRK